MTSPADSTPVAAAAPPALQRKESVGETYFRGKSKTPTLVRQLSAESASRIEHGWVMACGGAADLSGTVSHEAMMEVLFFLLTSVALVLVVVRTILLTEVELNDAHYECYLFLISYNGHFSRALYSVL
jgi:hypothetical protein